jgi:hypothetical protein
VLAGKMKTEQEKIPMLFPWKRSELWLGSLRQEYSKILDVLSEHKIEYSCKITGEAGSARYLTRGRGIGSRWGENPEVTALYKIYVRKDLPEYARHLITAEMKEGT